MASSWTGCRLGGPGVTVDQIRAHIDPRRHEFADPRSLVLPALKYAQTEKGHLTEDDLDAVARATGFSQAYVESVATFYDRLYLRPVGRRVVSVCVTLSCMLRGSDEVMEAVCDHLGLDHHGGTTPDGAITVQEAQCLGACDRAPCIQVDAENSVGPLTPGDAVRLVDDVRDAAPPQELWR
jgi:NADH:ubiquinone oxidoreductase subunit E